eukprot:1640617-Amphidinium_carterae.1
MEHSTSPSFPCMLDAMLASDDDTVPGTPEVAATALDAAGGGECHDAVDDATAGGGEDGGDLDAGLNYRPVVPFEELVYESMEDFLQTCTLVAAVPSPMGLVQPAFAGFLMSKYPERYEYLRGRVRDGVVSKALVDWGFVIVQRTALDGSRPKVFEWADEEAPKKRGRKSNDWESRRRFCVTEQGLFHCLCSIVIRFLMLSDSGVEFCRTVKAETTVGLYQCGVWSV